MSTSEYTLNVKRELLTALMAHQLPCCHQSFMVGLLQGPRLLGFVKMRRALRRMIARYLQAHAETQTTIKIRGSRVLLHGTDQVVLREKFVERIRRTSAALSGKHCQIAFLQGLFISRGYLQNPGRGYHLELRLNGRWLTVALKKVLCQLRLRFSVYQQDSHVCFYMKSGRRITRFLNLLGLFEKSLEFSDLRATRTILSMVNRQVNSETANISRLIGAAEESIRYIKELLNYEDQEIWTESLRQLALMRLKFPHDGLETLGTRFSPSLSKSAVNHRLRRIKTLHAKIFGKMAADSSEMV